MSAWVEVFIHPSGSLVVHGLIELVMSVGVVLLGVNQVFY